MKYFRKKLDLFASNIENLMFNLTLAIAATAPMIIIFSVNTQFSVIPALKPCISYLLILGFIIFINIISIIAIHFYASKEIIHGKFEHVETANNVFLPNYLGYFFVAVSITRLSTFLLVYCLTVLFVMLSQTMYYNPFFLLFHYNFYYVTNETGLRVFFITKTKVRSVYLDEFAELRRINDWTYIEV